MKKIFLLPMTLIFVLVSSLFGLNTFTIYAHIDNDLELAHTNEETILNDTYEQVYNSFIVRNEIYNNKQYNIYDENFAGVFVDSQGVLNIAYVNNNTLTYTSSINNNSVINFVEFTFSYNYLQQVLNCIEDVMIEYNVIMVQISDEDNQVLLFMKDNSKIPNIIQYLESKELYEQSAISFICDPLVNFSKTFETSYGGESIFYMEPNPDRPGYLNVFRGTIGVQAINNVTGELGILTNEHVAPMGRNMYYGEHFDHTLSSLFTKQVFLGTPSITHSGDTIDASFVPFENQSNWEITPYGKYNSTIFSNIFLGNDSQIINGCSITKIGQTTGITTGTINNRNTSINVEGTLFSNVMIYTNSSQAGDSGGPVYYNNGTDLFLIGLNFAGGTILNKTVGVACRISNVISELNVTPITNDSFSTTILPDGTVQLDAINFNFNGAFVVPSSLNGRIVSKIGPNVFKNRNKITEIILPNTINSIGDYAFENCSSLRSVTLSTSLITIGLAAFKGCASLESISIPNSVTHIDTSAFEGCSYLQSVTLSTNLIAIGSSAFKGCASLESISIPNSVTHIDTSAFEGCSYLQSVTLSNNLIAIGSSAFKGCASLARITIPNTVTNIDTSAFEGCSYLQSVTLSTNLIAIGSSAFKGCGSLERIVIPLSVQYIDDEAFKNCSSLSVVTVNRRITNITNLGVSVYDGCNASLKIIVPVNRIAEYKNKEYWSSYRNKIMPSEDYTELEIDCEGNVSESLSLSKATNELYKLNVNCSKSYKINANSSKTINIIIYDANMNVISSGSNTVTQFLGCGTYYISFEFDDTNASGTFEIGISLTWTSSNILLNKGTNNIKNSMHLNNENVYHCSYKYLNNQGEGFYRFSLNVGSNIILPEGTIKIYSNINKTELLNRYGSTGINEQAITYNGENEIYVFLPENGYYYIDVVLPKSTYSLITLTIEQVEKNDINYQNRLATIGFDELFDNKTVTNYFEEVTISHRSKIELDIVTSGTINRNIPIYIFEKHRDPGYEPGDNHYYLVLEYTNNITSINSGPVFTVILNPGTYYIGYSDNFDKVQIQFALRRKVNTDLNIDGTLVTDPARNQGFPLGSEVTFNNGSLRGNTITEGFTRNLYLMVEDRLRDPMSRLDYDWYSSNENVAKVTKYGTVLALNVSENTTVTIYAINKDDPSIVYKKDFIILKETKTEQIVIECNMSYSYSEENGMYTLELDFTNSPYPYIGYYVWDIECFNGINVDMEHHGLVSSTGPGAALLTANYTLNMRIFLKIHLTITE